jgi:lipoprotein Spr
MVKALAPALVTLVFLSSCTTFKPLNFTSNKQVATAPASPGKARFIEDISVTPESNTVNRPEPKAVNSNRGPVSQATTITPVKDDKAALADLLAHRTPEVESASAVELKYAVLLNTEVEYLPSRELLEAVDEWYGVRYRVGGNTKSGVDCSGFTVAVFAAAYGLNIPRISREQYRTSKKLSTTELREGDLVFFNTNGRGVSHVGVYLGNNKFIHASVSRGVMVNDLFEPYYLKRFVGGGRIDNETIAAAQ